MRSFLVGVGEKIELDKAIELERIKTTTHKSSDNRYEGSRDARDRWIIDPPFYVLQATMRGLKTNIKMNVNICTKEKDKFIQGSCYQYQHNKIWGHGCHISEYLNKIPCTE